VGADRLTPVLQDLLRDEVPVRNLRRILELLLRFTEDAPAWDPAAAAAHVRAGMADGIASQAARGTETVVVYLVDPALERLLEAGAADAGDRLAAALRAEREHLPRTAMVPVVLTRSELRARVRALLAPEFPEQRVIGYAELPPGFNVQPVARLAPV
jgi:flagellar biosynthesis component FlhA